MLKYILGLLCFIGAVIYALNTVATGYQINNATYKDITAHSVGCKRVTNNSGSSIFVSTKTSAEWADFRTDTPTGVTIANCPSCEAGGYYYQTYCFYEGANGASCTTTCSTHAGCNLTGTRNEIGTSGTLAKCDNVIENFNGTQSTTDNTSAGYDEGCVRWDAAAYGMFYYRFTAVATTCGAAIASAHRLCACNE